MGLSRKLSISGVVLFVFGVSFGFVVFPRILKSQVLAESGLKNGSVIRQMWSKVPFPLEFNVYVFNVTNPMEITNGEKPILREVGPYVYDEWLEKVDLVDREDDDTLEYSRRRTWIFNSVKSKSLTGNEIVTVPHLFILGAVMATMRDRPNMIGLAGKAMDSIFKKPETIFIQTSAHDFLFGGLLIDCNVKDFAATATCTFIKDSPDLIHDGDNRYRMSVFGHKNGTVDANRIRVKRGLKDVRQVGEVTEYKGESEQTVWPEGSRCNVIGGTDGTIVRPYLFGDEDIVSYSPDFCRTFTSRSDGTLTSVAGIHTNHYTFDFGDLSREPEWNCFCDAADTCTKKGLYDLFKCIGVPMVVSLPHFYKVDKTYLKQVVGLRPSKKIHQVDFDFEPITGTPISGRNRVQFNMFVYPIEKLKIMKTFATALIPIFWIDENVTIPDEFLDQIRMLFMAMHVVTAIKWFTIIFGMALCGAGAGLEYMKRQAETEVEALSRRHTGSGIDDSPEKKRPLAEEVPPRGRGGGICAMSIPKYIGIGGVVILGFGVFFLCFVFPPVLKAAVKEASKLKHRSQMREMWEALPFPMVFKIYVFNVTNSAEVSKGEKPIVDEVGPYVYDEWLEKLDLEDRDEDDTVEYSTRATWIFNAEKSKGLTGHEKITVPHLFMLSVIMTAMRDKPAMISVAGKAMDSIFKKPPSIFIETTPYELFFGGLSIDCSVKDFAGSAICSLLKDSTDLIRESETSYRFSVFGPRNATINNNRLRVKRGVKDVMQVGRVMEYKGQPYQTVWPEGTRCNELNGTDGTIFAPYLFEDDDIVSFSTDICRSMSTHWDGTYTSVGGMHTNHYTADFGDLSTETENKCFCDSDDTCPKKGLYDLFKCLGVPMVVSLPHFYKVDEMYLEQVDGLSPSQKKHQLDIDFEPMSGTPLSARKRIQFNMFVFPIEKVKTMKTFATALMPLFWIEESITLPKKFLAQVKLLFTVLIAVKILKWLSIVGGISLALLGAGLEYRRRQAEKKVNITGVQPMSGNRNNNSAEKKWPLDANALQADQVPPRYVERD